MKRSFLFAAIAASIIAAPAFAADQPIVGAPGTVPHPVAQYLPISIDKNMCLMCHREQAAGAVRKKGEIPTTHYDAPGKISFARYECMLCHAESTSGAQPLAPVDANEKTE
ncbi:nitrate reductase cytochrome c-type subunit [Sutterella sp.]|uniref:nitrate reductase cytochrome c-type subunit n=1 Tax=Sutterella sp. TaxID=1981025 RepID=UPI0026DF9BC8|nr:nitrate reductase cytochrome c-type subunit [Sutterella sp.]MDO5530490.1 nitrate reductase cytochrome c-type subunit [Sutterella sp.]